MSAYPDPRVSADTCPFALFATVASERTDEEDHFLPLELGGAPKDSKNLWPEPHAGSENSASKDSVENAVKKAVCAKKATLAAAQKAMLADWTTAESKLGIG